MKSIATRFRAYQLGNAGSSFSYFADGHFTLLEGRLTDVSRASLVQEMAKCEVHAADVLHITSWDADHCNESELVELLSLTRPLKLELPGYDPHTENGQKCLEILREYINDARRDNRAKTKIRVTPTYIGSLKSASDLAFDDVFYNPLQLDENCPNNNSTVKNFRRGSFNVLSLGDIESQNIGARLRRSSILKRETDVMILAHHGADNGVTTKNFISRISPNLAICSSDYDNKYDHPRQKIRDLLYKQGVTLMTTKTGDIIVLSIGDHTGHYQAINLKAGSTAISSSYNFYSKKRRLLTYNGDSLRNLYNGRPGYRR